MNENQAASMIQLLGAGCFGCLIGWYIYYVNRYRKGDVQLGDLVTIIGALGGGTILTLFPASSDLFGAYGLGLFTGFFGYFVILNVLVRRSDNFNTDWFLDGRRKIPKEPWVIPEYIEQTIRAMKAKKKDEDIND